MVELDRQVLIASSELRRMTQRRSSSFLNALFFRFVSGPLYSLSRSGEGVQKDAGQRLLEPAMLFGRHLS